MKESNEAFQNQVSQVLLPKLSVLGFERIYIKGNWIKPAFLFEQSDIWFSASWDWKDDFLDVNLGRLFLFRDVLPSIIIIGPVHLQEMAFENNKSSHGYKEYFYETFIEIADSLEEKIQNFDILYPEAYANRIKINAEIMKYLDKQVKRNDLPLE